MKNKETLKTYENKESIFDIIKDCTDQTNELNKIDTDLLNKEKYVSVNSLDNNNKRNKQENKQEKTLKDEFKEQINILKEEKFFIFIWAIFLAIVFVRTFTFSNLNSLEASLLLISFCILVLCYFLPFIKVPLWIIGYTIYDYIVIPLYNILTKMINDNKLKEMRSIFFRNIVSFYKRYNFFFNIIFEYLLFLISLPFSFYIAEKIVETILLGNARGRYKDSLMYTRQGMYSHMTIILISIFTIFIMGVTYKLIKEIKKRHDNNKY
jgi:hypothetical protein